MPILGSDIKGNTKQLNQYELNIIRRLNKAEDKLEYIKKEVGPEPPPSDQ